MSLDERQINTILSSKDPVETLKETSKNKDLSDNVAKRIIGVLQKCRSMNWNPLKASLKGESKLLLNVDIQGKTFEILLKRGETPTL